MIDLSSYLQSLTIITEIEARKQSRIATWTLCIPFYIYFDKGSHY